MNDHLNELANMLNQPDVNTSAKQSIRVEGDGDEDTQSLTPADPAQFGSQNGQNGANTSALPQVPPQTQSAAQAQGNAPVGNAGGQGQQKKGPQSPIIPQQTSRSNVTTITQTAPQVTQVQNGGMLSLKDSSDPNAYHDNLVMLADKSLQMAQHDRSLAIATLQVHLDRGEVLDQLPLSMPVSSVIGDNTGACLKSLELAQKAGDRMFKIAELLVNAKKADDTALINAYKAEIAANKNKPDSEWGDEDDLPA